MRFKPLLSPYAHLEERLVFLTDGALWIKNWMSETYPNALQILDFYHVKEHLGRFAQFAVPESVERAKWLDLQAEKLKNGKLKAVLESIKTFVLTNENAKNEQNNLLTRWPQVFPISKPKSNPQG